MPAPDFDLADRLRSFQCIYWIGTLDQLLKNICLIELRSTTPGFLVVLKDMPRKLVASVNELAAGLTIADH